MLPPDRRSSRLQLSTLATGERVGKSPPVLDLVLSELKTRKNDGELVIFPGTPSRYFFKADNPEARGKALAGEQFYFYLAPTEPAYSEGDMNDFMNGLFADESFSLVKPRRTPTEKVVSPYAIRAGYALSLGDIEFSSRFAQEVTTVNYQNHRQADPMLLEEFGLTQWVPQQDVVVLKDSPVESRIVVTGYPHWILAQRAAMASKDDHSPGGYRDLLNGYIMRAHLDILRNDGDPFAPSIPKLQRLGVTVVNFLRDRATHNI